MTTQDTTTKEQIMAALRQQNITDLNSLAEFMIEKRASLTPYQGDQGQAQPLDSKTFVGKFFVYTKDRD